MRNDFTLSKYRELCESIKGSKYQTLTMNEYFLNKKEIKNFILLRHDIDRKPNNALDIARIENEHGIKATYYFRITKDVFNHNIIKTIQDQGHEIGFHYEDLSKTNGDYNKAIKLFEDELTEFRKISDVKTICMHGSPLSKHDNRDLWKKFDYHTFNLNGEAYLSVDNGITYYSDTGRTWSLKNKIRDFIPNGKLHDNISITDDIIELIKSGNFDSLYLLTHPERWTDNHIEWLSNLTKDTTVNLGKKILAIVR